MKFKLGSLVYTKGISETIKKDRTFLKEIIDALNRYVDCDWGDLCPEDCALNKKAIKNNERILASYTTSYGKIYIITEWDHSVTTILFTYEY